MTQLGVTVAVVRGDLVLLTKREDLEVWCLPGGSIEVGESAAQAAVRETQEEAGLDVRLTRLIGVYSRFGFLGHAHSLVFSVEPFGEEVRLQPGETVDIGWFDQDRLPEPLSCWK